MLLVLIIIFVALAAAILVGFAPLVPMWSHSRRRTWQKVIALTFDDGPSVFTPQVLDILKTTGVPATFFVVGENARRHPEIVRRAAREGHVIGNHSDDHILSKLVLRGPRLQLKNMHAADGAIHAAIHERPRWYRAPHGYRSPFHAYAVHRAGYRSITWSAMTFDYLDKVSPRYIVKRIVAKARPGGIIALHDGLETKPDTLVNRGNLVAALPEIIQGLRAAGYQFVTVPELFQEPAYRRQLYLRIIVI